MRSLILIAGAVCAITSFLHIASISIMIARTRRQQVARTGRGGAEGVTVIRPVCGLENFSEDTLRSSFHLKYPQYEVVFCVAHAHDEIVPLVRRLIAAHLDVPARLLIGNDHVSDNPKLNNVVKGWAAARYPWIVLADSNVLMPPDYLQRMLAAWRADTGLVCSPPVGSAPLGIWAELECAFLNTYQARWQYFADQMGRGFAQGKSMLWRRDILEAGGGIRALGAEVAEDAASTKLVAKQGLRVRLVDRPFEQPLGYRSAAEVWQRQVRWARLRRDTFQHFFALEIFAGALPPVLACFAWATAFDLPIPGVLGPFVLAWYAGEALLAHAAGWHLSARSILIWMLRDLLLPVLWVASWVGNEFVWRGNVMHVADRGRTA